MLLFSRKTCFRVVYSVPIFEKYPSPHTPHYQKTPQKQKQMGGSAIDINTIFFPVITIFPP